MTTNCKRCGQPWDEVRCACGYLGRRGGAYNQGGYEVKRETRIIFDDEGRSERVVFVRGQVSKKYNPKEVWLRLTRADRLAQNEAWKARLTREQQAEIRERSRLDFLAKHREKRIAWEQANAHRRRSPERRLFSKLRRAGVPICEARLQANYLTHLVPEHIKTQILRSQTQSKLPQPDLTNKSMKSYHETKPGATRNEMGSTLQGEDDGTRV